MNYNAINIGTVVAVDDPDNIGRIKVWFSDDARLAGPTSVKDNKKAFNEFAGRTRWANYASPLSSMFRNDSTGQTTGYGFFPGTPKIQQQVLCFFANGNPDHCYWFAQPVQEGLTATVPKGTYTLDAGATSDKDRDNVADNYIPKDHFGNPIKALAAHIKKAFFSGGGSTNRQAASRTITRSFGRVKKDAVSTENNTVAGYTITEGSKTQLENQFGCWTSPCGQAIILDDDQQSQGIKFQTKTGHSIIMDDTNERIYIMPSKGETWIQLDSSGNIDLYCSRRLSVNAEWGINFTTSGQFRLHAKEGVHISSGDLEDSARTQAGPSTYKPHNQAESTSWTAGEIRIDSLKDINIRSGGNMKLHSKAATYFESDTTLNLHSAADTNTYSGGKNNTEAKGQIVEKAPQIHMNSFTAISDPSSVQANEEISFVPNRVPRHEPWARLLQNNFATNIVFEDQDAKTGFADDGRQDSRYQVGDNTIERESPFYQP